MPRRRAALLRAKGALVGLPLVITLLFFLAIESSVTSEAAGKTLAPAGNTLWSKGDLWWGCLASCSIDGG